MKQNKPVILFGAGQTGMKALEYYGWENIYCYVDKHKAGLYFCGIPVISIDDLQKIKFDYRIIISTAPDSFEEIKQELDRAGIQGAVLYNPDYGKTYKKNPRLEKFKNMHKGKRCFLIGNGSSLRTEDLEIIDRHKDITFASNRIFKIYKSTNWRPDYYFAGDQRYIIQNLDDIIAEKENKFIVYTKEYITPDILSKLIDVKDLYLIKARYLQYDSENNKLLPFYEDLNEPYPSFSEDPSMFVYEGFSITYLMMQWAAYMGFSKLFLLGVDHNFKLTRNYFEKFIPSQEVPGEIANDHFSTNYFKKDELINIADLQSSTQAYGKAEQYSIENGFRIYNATRGGNLEVFERVDFNVLMNNKSQVGD